MTQRWALILDGAVTEITDLDPAGRFVEALVWVECGPEVEVGYTYADDEFSPPAPPVDTRSYADKRRPEYPPMADYLDGVVKGDEAQINTYIAACLAVKAKYPKS